MVQEDEFSYMKQRASTPSSFTSSPQASETKDHRKIAGGSGGTGTSTKVRLAAVSFVAFQIVFLQHFVLKRWNTKQSRLAFADETWTPTENSETKVRSDERRNHGTISMPETTIKKNDEHRFVENAEQQRKSIASKDDNQNTLQNANTKSIIKASTEDDDPIATAYCDSLRGKNGRRKKKQRKLGNPDENDNEDHGEDKNLDLGNCFCAPWTTNMDSWWTHAPEWDVTLETDKSVCFTKQNNSRGRFLREVYEIQYNSKECSNVFTKHMWNSGWNADTSNLADGLLYAYESHRPFQIRFAKDEPQRWHYAALKDGSKPVCESADMFCYFLQFGICEPGEQLDVKPHARNPFASSSWGEPTREMRWLRRYATRPQQWLRKLVYDEVQEVERSMPLQTPCIAIHVRRADVVLHNTNSRRYFPVSAYLDKIPELQDGANILLFTDDANAVDEAQEFHSQYNWMYIDRPRHRGTEGGWENQIPSNDPLTDVIQLMTVLRVATRCDVFVHGSSGFSDLIYQDMKMARGKEIQRYKVDGDLDDVYARKNRKSLQQLEHTLEQMRQDKDRNEDDDSR